jgi:hypothetical protein
MLIAGGERASAMTSNPVPIPAPCVIAPAASPAPRAVQEEKPARGVAADRQPLANSDQLDEWEEQVANEGGPAGSVGSETAIVDDPEPRPRDKTSDIGRPTGPRVEQAADHVADRGKRPQLTRVGRAVGHLDLMVGQIPNAVGCGSEMVVVAVVDRHSSEPMPAGPVARIRDPQEIGERPASIEHRHAGREQADAAHGLPAVIEPG